MESESTFMFIYVWKFNVHGYVFTCVEGSTQSFFIISVAQAGYLDYQLFK